MLTVLALDHKHYFTDDHYPIPDLKLWLQDIACPSCGGKQFWRCCGFSPRYLQVSAEDIRLVYLQRVYCRSCRRLSRSGSRYVASRTHVVLPFDVVFGQWLSVGAQKAVHDQVFRGVSQQQVAATHGLSRSMVHDILHRIQHVLSLLHLMLLESDSIARPLDSFLSILRRGLVRYGSLLFSVQKRRSSIPLVPP